MGFRQAQTILEDRLTPQSGGVLDPKGANKKTAGINQLLRLTRFRAGIFRARLEIR